MFETGRNGLHTLSAMPNRPTIVLRTSAIGVTKSSVRSVRSKQASPLASEQLTTTVESQSKRDATKCLHRS